MNSLRQYLLDETEGLSDAEREAALSDYGHVAVSGLYNVFGFMYTDRHLVQFYCEHKDAIREELAELADYGISARDAIRHYAVQWGSESVTGTMFEAAAIGAAVEQASRALLEELYPDSNYL